MQALLLIDETQLDFPPNIRSVGKDDQGADLAADVEDDRLGMDAFHVRMMVMHHVPPYGRMWGNDEDGEKGVSAAGGPRERVSEAGPRRGPPASLNTVYGAADAGMTSNPLMGRPRYGNVD